MTSTASRLAEDFGQETVPVGKIVQARKMMAEGLDLHQTAHQLGLRSRDLDIALWDGLCRFGGRP